MGSNELVRRKIRVCIVERHTIGNQEHKYLLHIFQLEGDTYLINPA